MPSPTFDKTTWRNSDGDYYDLLLELSDVGRQALLLSLPDESANRERHAESANGLTAPLPPPKNCMPDCSKLTSPVSSCSSSSKSSIFDCKQVTSSSSGGTETPSLVYSPQLLAATPTLLPVESGLSPLLSSSSMPVTPLTPLTPIPTTCNAVPVPPKPSPVPPPKSISAAVSMSRVGIIYPSRAAPPPPEFATLVLTGGDRLRISGFTPVCNDVVRRALQEGWHGVESRRCPGAAEWKLTGKPWLCADTSHSPHRLLVRIVTELASVGWRLALCGSGGAAAGILRVDGTQGLSRAFFFQRAKPRSRAFFSILLCARTATLLDPPDDRVKEAFVFSMKAWPRDTSRPEEYPPDPQTETGVFTVALGPVSAPPRTGVVDGPTWPGDGGRLAAATAAAHAHAFGALGAAFLNNFGTAGFECVATYDVYPPRKTWNWSEARAGGSSTGPAVDVWVFAQR